MIIKLWIDLVGGNFAIIINCCLGTTMTGPLAINIWATTVRANRNTLETTGAYRWETIANVGNRLKRKPFLLENVILDHFIGKTYGICGTNVSSLMSTIRSDWSSSSRIIWSITIAFITLIGVLVLMSNIVKKGSLLTMEGTKWSKCVIFLKIVN